MPSVVFISWSGARAFAVAGALRESLRILVPHATLWFSDRDIDAGAFWDAEIRNQIALAAFAVVCVTPENLERPWLNYEAGAIAEKGVPVCPYLLTVQKNDLQPTPLSRLNAVSADEAGTRKLVHSINRAVAGSLPNDVIDQIFDKFWPSLAESLAAIPAIVAPSSLRTAESKIDETLALAQRIAERTAALQPRGGKGIASIIKFRIEHSLAALGLQKNEYRLTVFPDHTEGYGIVFCGATIESQATTVHVGADVDDDTLHNVARIGCKHMGIGNWA